MDKIYRHLPWLSAAEACDFLGQLTHTEINVQTLKVLCTARLCNAYVDCHGVQGITQRGQKVCADGRQMLLVPSSLTATEYADKNGALRPALEAQQPLMKGPVVLYADNGTHVADDIEWTQTNGQLEHLAIFKTSELETLADKLNSTTEQRNQEKECLEQQLDQEKGLRLALELEIETLKQQLALTQTELAKSHFGHRSEGLTYLTEALSQFWSTFDPDDPGTAPSKSDVVMHLKKTGASQNQAEAVDLILRPSSVRTAHLKNRRA